MDDWAACDAEAVVTALSLRYRFSRANAVQLLRDQGPRFRTTFVVVSLER